MIFSGFFAVSGKDAFRASAPTVTVSTTTNYNQNIATLNGTVSANNAVTTTIKFQISTNDSTWYDAVGGTTISNTSSQSVSVYYNATGYNNGGTVNLSPGTTYYVRLVATNSAGTTNSSSTSFTTWALQSYERTSAGGVTFTIPTVTPTGGSAVAVSIYNIIMFGPGGGGCYTGYGGGGGGYQNVSSRALSGSRSVTASVAAGAAGTNSTTGFTPSADTTITGDLTSLTALRGNGGSTSYGSGSSPYWTTGYEAAYDPDGEGKGYPNGAYGGGGGAGAVGGNAIVDASTCQGGTGGIGVSITSGGVTRQGGAGGGGASIMNQAVSGGEVQGVRGAYNTYGSGGNSAYTGGAGQDGYIRFQYYAATALA